MEGTNLGYGCDPRASGRVKGLGLHNDLQNEHSIVGNNVGLLLMLHYGTEEQKAEWVDRPGRPDVRGFAFGITEPATTARTPPTWRPTPVRDGDEWVLNGEKTWNTGIHKAEPRHGDGAHQRQGGRR